MIEEILNIEGPFMRFLDKVGQLIALSVLWILGCVPVITIGTSTTALYYAVVKSVHHGQGSAVQEFWRSYRANLGRGVAVTVTTLALGGLLTWNLNVLQQQVNPLLSGAAVIGLILLCFAAVYICPVLSRFTLHVIDAWKLAFVMSLRYLHITLAVGAGFLLLLALQIYVLPIPTIALTPACWCFGTTFLIEKALRRYMPPKNENDNAWYYE